MVFWAAAAACGGDGRHLNVGALTTTATAPRAATPMNSAPALDPPTTTAPATTAPPTTAAPTTVAKPPPVLAGAGVAVGDSVLQDVGLYAPATLQSHNIAINAAVGRQWPAGITILSGLRASGKLPPVVVVALGSNGRISDTLFEQMMQVCAGAQRVVFMTVTGPLIGNNPILTAGVARHAPVAVLADWNATASAHPDWFAPDHVHVGPAGAAALGNLLASVS
ncbi:MAG: hypothetical protein QOK39_217 [Acidimicrobiaceae bacterium]|nr:hypothetical protein [Acidimicrobiaceae bacterium]